ncbi:hypothetical protein T265_04910 [Opisthorchis viverrini]|uniref:Trafficking protein particle complex subunit 13 n=2 Tax=Opisthorchis viverrini TaxID=6198 RepID=A0A074ZY59_OPIVI|nr:hypothetical protein T265_04910 [Opisthorchis viverrini]KER28235.1 hypothetical protein T265_04910 [Opisthorchis viverrini]
MTARQDTDVLSLRVMRLNRPQFVRQQCEPAELYIDDIASALTTADAGVRADLDGVALHRLSISDCAQNDGTEGFTMGDQGDQEKTEADHTEEAQNHLVRVKIGGPGELLGLPQSFGSTYLGETFSAHVNLHNESNQICYNVELKVSLHNRIEWVTLSTTGTLTGASLPAQSPSSPEMSSQRSCSGGVDLHPGQSLNAIIHHELKELGIHTLRCVASYCLSSTASTGSQSVVSPLTPKSPNQWTGDPSALESFTFQRLYKFPVSKPLDVKKKFSAVDSNGCVFMEAEVQNLTSVPIYLERVVFEPSPNMRVVDLNTIDDGKSSVPTCGDLRCLRAHDIQQFLYKLIPDSSLLAKSPGQKMSVRSTQGQVRQPVPSGSVTASQLQQQQPLSAGRLDITWRSTMGERGRLQTSSLKYELPHLGDLQLKALSLPATVQMEQPFQITLELTNRSTQHMDLMLDLRSKPETDNSNECSFRSLPPLAWVGLTTCRLGMLPPGRSMPLSLSLMATVPGLQHVSGVLIHENTTERDYEFGDLGQVLVCS